MGYEEVKIGTEMHEFKLKEPVSGEIKEIRMDVGPNKSRVYTVNDKSFWGTTSLDFAIDRGNVKVGDDVRITLVDESFKFPSGRVGRLFKVEVKKD